jgi:flagellar protein FlgJ
MAEAQNFLDLNGLNSIRQQSNATDASSKKEALETAAKQFEAIFMQMLMKSMRKAEDVLASDSPFNSESTKFYRDMHDQQMSLDLSNNGSLGLSELIVRQLGGDSENFTAHNLVRSNGNLSAESSQLKNNSDLKPPFTTLPVPLPTPSPNSMSGVNPTEFQLPVGRQHNGIPFGLQAAAANAINNTTNNAAANAINNATNNPSHKPIVNSMANSQLENTSVKEAMVSFQQPKDFVSALTESAKQVEQQLKVPFAVVIAQAALETGWGQKIIKTEQGNSSHNLFNIKADSRWSGDKTHKETLEYQEGSMVKKREPFRVYQSMADSVKDYIHFLSNNDRYQGALKQVGDVEQFLHKLQSAGYATDPNYANKILGTLKTVKGILDKNREQ